MAAPELSAGTKYNLSHILNWNSMSEEDIRTLVVNMMRIGMDHIGDDNIDQVIKRTDKATLCNLQIPFMKPIRPVTAEDIKRWKGFKSNIAVKTPQYWHKKMSQLFPHILNFDQALSRAEKLWEMVEGKAPLPGEGVTDVFILRRKENPEQFKMWVYKQSEYDTMKKAWQEAMGSGKI